MVQRRRNDHAGAASRVIPCLIWWRPRSTAETQPATGDHRKDPRPHQAFARSLQASSALY